MYNEKMTLQEAAKQALAIQDACNLSGVVYAFARAMDAINDARANDNTINRNTHPIVTMHLLKLCELNGCGSTLHESYGPAEAACKLLAEGTPVVEVAA